MGTNRKERQRRHLADGSSALDVLAVVIELAHPQAAVGHVGREAVGHVSGRDGRQRGQRRRGQQDEAGLGAPPQRVDQQRTDGEELHVDTEVPRFLALALSNVSNVLGLRRVFQSK